MSIPKKLKIGDSVTFSISPQSNFETGIMFVYDNELYCVTANGHVKYCQLNAMGRSYEDDLPEDGVVMIKNGLSFMKFIDVDHQNDEVVISVQRLK